MGFKMGRFGVGTNCNKCRRQVNDRFNIENQQILIWVLLVASRTDCALKSCSCISGGTSKLGLGLTYTISEAFDFLRLLSDAVQE
jgi:hypothetical protein